jgi:hypothetical protein
MNFSPRETPVIYWPLEIPATTITFTPSAGSPVSDVIPAGRYLFGLLGAVAAQLSVALIGTALAATTNFGASDAELSADGAPIIRFSGTISGAGVITISPNPELWGVPAAGLAVTSGAADSYEVGGHWRPASIVAEYREVSTANASVTETVSGSTSYRVTWGVRAAGVLTAPFVFRANLYDDALQSGQYLTAAGRTFAHNNTLEGMIIAARTERRMALLAGTYAGSYPYPDKKNALVSIVDETILSDPRAAVSEVDGGRYGDITLPLRRISYFPD